MESLRKRFMMLNDVINTYNNLKSIDSDYFKVHQACIIAKGIEKALSLPPPLRSVGDTFFVKCLVLSDNLFIFAPSKSVKNQKIYGKDEENNSSGRDGSDELYDGCWAGECV